MSVMVLVVLPPVQLAASRPTAKRSDEITTLWTRRLIGAGSYRSSSRCANRNVPV